MLRNYPVCSSDEVERTCLEPNWAVICPASPDQQTVRINHKKHKNHYTHKKYLIIISERKLAALF